MLMEMQSGWNAMSRMSEEWNWNRLFFSLYTILSPTYRTGQERATDQ